MMRDASICLSLVCVVGVALAWTSKSYGDDANEVQRKILQRWADIEREVATVDCTWKGERILGKGSISLIAGPVKDMPVIPPTDRVVPVEGRVAISGERARYSYKSEGWSPRRREILPKSFTSVFDGTQYKFFDDLGSAPYAGFIKNSSSNDNMATITIAGIPLTFQPKLSTEQRYGFSQMRLSQRAVATSEGEEAYEFVLANNAEGWKRLLWVSKRTLLPVAHELDRGYTASRVAIRHVANESGFFIPHSWEYVKQSSADQLLESGSFTVTQCHVNSKLSDSEFDIQFPPNTWVKERTGANTLNYVIQSDGQPGRKISSRAAPTYEQLTSQGRRPVSTWTPRILTIAGVAVLLLLLWFALRYWRATSR